MALAILRILHFLGWIGQHEKELSVVGGRAGIGAVPRSPRSLNGSLNLVKQLVHFLVERFRFRCEV
jgi:hypothetical protein